MLLLEKSWHVLILLCVPKCAEGSVAGTGSWGVGQQMVGARESGTWQLGQGTGDILPVWL